MKLTVIVRDDAPMLECNDHPSYRTVIIKLTDEQSEELNQLRKTEAISQCIIEGSSR